MKLKILSLVARLCLGWSSIGLHADTPPIEWLESIEVASGSGERGPWQQNESRYDFVDDPGVALDAAGTLATVWVDQRNKAVLFQRFEANGNPRFATPVTVSRSPQVFSWIPRVALAPNAPQQVWVVWQDILFTGGSHGGDILIARSLDGGASFSDPLNLSKAPSGAGKGRVTRDYWHNGSYDLALGPDGVLYVVWTEYEGRLMFARSTDGGASFTTARHIAGDDARPTRAPALGVGRDGTLFLAWTLGDQERAEIHVARSTDGGDSFGEAHIPVITGTYSDGPKLALDAQGVLHLVYASSAGGPLDVYRIHYTRSTDQGESYAAPRDISAPVPQGAPSANFPHLALDGAGNPVVVWELHPHPHARPRGLGIALSPDGGRSFTRPDLVPGSVPPDGGNNGSQQGLLMQKLAVNASGAIAIANSSLRETRSSRVWLMRGQIAPLDAPRQRP
jgi:hypothetical protein